MNLDQFGPAIIADRDTLLVLADYLEDHGDARCDGLRWLWTEGKCSQSWGNSKNCWWYGRDDDYLPYHVSPAIIRNLKEGKQSAYGGGRLYIDRNNPHTVLTSYLDAAQAWVAVHQPAASKNA